MLQQIGLLADVRPADIDESVLAAEMPREYVERLAVTKAQTVFDGLVKSDGSMQQTARVVLGADTTVVCNDRMLGKPQGRRDALDMLQMLSGSTHWVYTGTSIVCAAETSATAEPA